MGVGKPSKSPCRICGQVKNNVMEPVRMYTVCEDHRKYYTKEEKIKRAVYTWAERQVDLRDGLNGVLDDLIEEVIEVIK